MANYIFKSLHKVRLVNQNLEDTVGLENCGDVSASMSILVFLSHCPLVCSNLFFDFKPLW